MIRRITLDELIATARSMDRAFRTSEMVRDHLGANVEHVTFDEALRHTLDGNERLVPEAEALMDGLNLTVETRGREWQPTVAGAYPVVPEFLTGRPDCMRGMVYEVSETMPVRLVVDIFASWAFTGPQLRKRGAVVLALAMMLQRYRPVELEILTSSTGLDRLTPMGLLIPIHAKPLNLSVAAFLFSPAFFRLLTGSYLDRVMGVPPSIPADMWHHCRKELHLGPSDLYIEPAIGYSEQTDEILGNARQWLQKQLDRFMGAR